MRLATYILVLLTAACSSPPESRTGDRDFNEPITEEALTITTDDGVQISALIAFPETAPATPAPAVIFIHQGGSSKAEWIETNLYKEVIHNGMITLAYDVRGHGASGGEGGVSLFDDPTRAPLDLQAMINYLASRQDVDRERIAIVGSSIGANLACVGAGSSRYNIRTAVALSGKTSAVINLAGGEENISDLSSIYLIASKNEQDGMRAIWARELFERADDPKRLEIVDASTEHGTAIFKDDPELQDRILDWLKLQLEIPK